jgi:hypothetical protein
VFTALVGLTIAPSEIDPLLGSIAVLAIAAGAGAAGVQRTPCAGVGASDVGRGLDLGDRSGSCRAWALRREFAELNAQSGTPYPSPLGKPG